MISRVRIVFVHFYLGKRYNSLGISGHKQMGRFGDLWNRVRLSFSHVFVEDWRNEDVCHKVHVIAIFIDILLYFSILYLAVERSICFLKHVGILKWVICMNYINIIIWYKQKWIPTNTFCNRDSIYYKTFSSTQEIVNESNKTKSLSNVSRTQSLHTKTERKTNIKEIHLKRKKNNCHSQHNPVGIITV